MIKLQKKFINKIKLSFRANYLKENENNMVRNTIFILNYFIKAFLKITNTKDGALLKIIKVNGEKERKMVMELIQEKILKL